MQYQLYSLQRQDENKMRAMKGITVLQSVTILKKHEGIVLESPWDMTLETLAVKSCPCVLKPGRWEDNYMLGKSWTLSIVL